MDFRDHTVEELAGRVRDGDLSARELCEAALARIEEVNPAVGAFVALDGERAFRDAAGIDDRVAAGEQLGPLAGIPIGVKDLEDAQGFVTTHGSLVHRDDPAATEDSVLVARLRAAGCVVVGKTNTPEMGHKGDTVNRVFDPTRNPWDRTRSAGGSSGGSAAALAAGMVPLATGSDGGGSIRIPSALCGFTGHKPSLGRVPTGGPDAPNWADLSVKGPMAIRARDIALALDVAAGPHPTDLRALPAHHGSFRRELEDLHPPRKALWSPTLGYSPVDPEVLAVCQAAVGRLAGAGTDIEEVDTVFEQDPVLDWMTLTSVGNSRSIEHLRGTDRWDQLEPAVRAGAEWADANVSAGRYAAANDAAHRRNFELTSLLHDGRVLLCPTVAAQAPPIGGDGVLDGHDDPNWVRFTYPFNMTRSPAGTVTAGFTEGGLPVGLQVVGPQHGDVVVLRTLAFLEDLLALDRRAPVT